jgi:hypothetical protein
MKLDNVKPLDIEPYIGKVKNRVALVGVELEGAWIQLPPGVAALEADGSVFDGRRPAGANHVGELPVGPVLPAGLKDLLRVNYPQKINHTCGMHVHMSFDTLWHYHLLMVPEYPVTVVEYLKKWATAAGIKDTHPIWPRLRHESRYCQNEFWPDAQAVRKDKGHNQEQHGHRYTHVHYCGARLNTIEIRTLPMMEKFKTAADAIHQVIAITNASLYILGRKTGKKTQQSKISLPDNMVYEETIIEQL